jgi:hypothetical protein
MAEDVTQSKTLITARAAAVTLGNADTVFVPQGCRATLKADGLAGAEEVDIYSVSLTRATEVMYDRSGNAQKLTATAPQIQIHGPERFTIAKDATAGACEVEVLL